jgi:hypothetical protein
MFCTSGNSGTAAVLTAVLTLVACDTTGDPNGSGGGTFSRMGNSIGSFFSSSEPPPSPAQQRLRQSAAQYSTATLLTGCVVGGLLGAAVGAAVKGKEGAAVGAGVGLAAGCLGGHYVAAANQSYANEQIALQQRIQAANRDIQETAQATADARQVVSQHKAEISRLNEQYRKRQIDAGAYDGQVAAAQRDIDSMKLLIDSKNKVLQAMERDIAAGRQHGIDTSQLVATRQRLLKEQQALQEQLNALVAAVDTMPAGVERPLVS